jgi:hypothetical protein
VDYNSTTTSTSTGKIVASSGRFVSDLFEAVSAVSATNPNPDTYGAVPIALDGASNGYLGSVYYPGHGGAGSVAASCACPNLNEKMTAVSGSSGSGYSCSPALDSTDSLTQQYRVLAAYDPAIHNASAATSQLLDPTAATVNATRVTLPTSSGGYKSYSRRIWTCAPPAYLDVGSKSCKIKESLHVCDNGSGSGIPSPVSPNLSGANGKEQFDNAANPKLACCLNAFDRQNPSNPVKYDCIENADQSPADFEKLWASTDPSETGGQGNAIVLTDGAGRPMTGFFTLSGARCAKYSELAGPIREAVVNPDQLAGQQTLSGGKLDPNSIQFTGNVFGPPPSVPAWFSTNKTVPDQDSNPARAARECPILARAAVIVSCGSGSGAGGLPQQFTDSKGNVHCYAAKSIKVHLRIQQIYRITGQAPIKTVDTLLDLDQWKSSSMNMEGLIRAKTGGFCPQGTSYLEGNCVYK